MDPHRDLLAGGWISIEIAALIETTQMGAALELRALGSHHTIGIRDQYRWHGGSRM